MVYICNMGKRFYKPPIMVDYLVFGKSIYFFGGFFVYEAPIGTRAVRLPRYGIGSYIIYNKGYKVTQGG